MYVLERTIISGHPHQDRFPWRRCGGPPVRDHSHSRSGHRPATERALNSMRRARAVQGIRQAIPVVVGRAGKGTGGRVPASFISSPDWGGGHISTGFMSPSLMLGDDHGGVDSVDSDHLLRHLTEN